MRKPSTIPLVILALVALIVFGYANGAAYRSGSHPDAEEAHQAAVQAMQAQPKTPPSSLSKRGPTGPPAPNAPAAATELTIGNPATAKTKLTYGYSADENVEEDPDRVNALVQALKDYAQSHPDTSVQLVCVDIPQEDRTDPSLAAIPLGLTKTVSRSRRFRARFPQGKLSCRY